MVQVTKTSLLGTIFLHFCVVSAADYGVGFHLSLDYGVASVYFPNQTTVDIAKIPGGLNYRQLMRDAYVPNKDRPSPSWQKESNHKQLSFGQQVLSQLRFVDIQSLRNLIPSRLGGKHPPPSAAPMLKALKTATESYLETTISSALVAFPFETTKEFRKNFSSAVSSILPSMTITSSPAGVLSGFAYELDDTEDKKAFASIEYSRAALTGHLIFLVSGVAEIRRELHDTDLGVDALHRAASESSNEMKLKNSLRNLLRMPIDGDYGRPVKHISNIILLGECAKDRRLNEVLKSVLGEEFRQPVGTSSRKLSGTIDSVYSAAGWAAYHSWYRLEAEEDCKNHPGHWCHEYPLK